VAPVGGRQTPAVPAVRQIRAITRAMSVSRNSATGRGEGERVHRFAVPATAAPGADRRGPAAFHAAALTGRAAARNVSPAGP